MSTIPGALRPARLARPRLQRGQAALLVVVLVAGAAALLVYGMVDTTSAALRRDKDVAAVLAQAKEALIGRAVSDDNRPGSLPCPDTDGDGSAELFAGGHCPSYIGFLPWRTLGLPDLRDDSGERLWYALSDRFRDDSSAGLLDSDTKGNRTVYRDSAATTITTEAVAIIFAAGGVIPGQNRACDPADTTCMNTQVCTTATSLLQKCGPANYLDTVAGVNNAATSGPFISAPRSTTFNDRLLVITTAELMPVVEQRVAREMLLQLKKYKDNSVCGCYPWAANNFDDDSVTGRTQGMVPIEVALPEAWGSGTIPGPLSWMVGSNEWGKKFYYAIAPSESEDHTAGTITVNGASKNLVLITTGPAGASRPNTNLVDYVDDAENRDGGTIYVTPLSTAYARDRVYTIRPGNIID